MGLLEKIGCSLPCKKRHQFKDGETIKSEMNYSSSQVSQDKQRSMYLSTKRLNTSCAAQWSSLITIVSWRDLHDWWYINPLSSIQSINFLMENTEIFREQMSWFESKHFVCDFVICHSLKQMRLGENKPGIKCHGCVCSDWKENFWLFSVCQNGNISSLLGLWSQYAALHGIL